MQGYWVTFANLTEGYCEGTNVAEAAKTAAAARRAVVKDIQRLPYPANPILFQADACPPFCYAPRTCKGRTSCPKRPACSE